MATRFYLRDNGAAPVSPTDDAAWDTAPAPFLRGPLLLTTDDTDTLVTVASFTSTTGQDCIHRQYVSEEMVAGKVFNTSVTYKCYVQVRESAANDNIVSRIGVRIVDSAGTTVRHTILAVADYSTGAEWSSTGARNKAFLDGDAGTGSYTTVTGDRLVVEIGHNDAAGATIEGRSRWGSVGTGVTDLPENETSTSTTERPWFEVSLDGLFSSGTGHTANPSDSLALTDAVAKTQGKASADTLSLADLFARTTVTSRTVPDTVALTDATTRAKTIPLAINDTVSLADAATPAKIKVVAVDDSVALSDSRAHGRGLGLADSLTLTDAQAKARGLGLADSLALTDAQAKAFGKAVADTVSLADSATPNLTSGGVNHTRDINDTVALTDARAHARGKAQADSVTLSDTPTRAVIAARTVQDTLALTDSATRTVTCVRTVTDSVTLADVATPSLTTGAVNHTRQVDDTVSLSDAIALGRGLARADTLALTDAVAKGRGLGRADSLALTDNFSRLATYQRTPSEQVLLTDLFARTATAVRTFADQVTLSDLIEPEVPGDLQVDDVLAVTDNFTSMLFRGEIYSGRIGEALSGSIDGRENGHISDTVAGVIEEVLQEV